MFHTQEGGQMLNAVQFAPALPLAGYLGTQQLSGNPSE